MSENRENIPAAEANAAMDGEAAEETMTTETSEPAPEPEQEAGAEPETASPDAEETPAAESAPDEAAVLRDRLLRLQADFDNYRKRMARDHQDFVAQAGADVLEAMLPPMDHLELAIDTMEKTAAADDPFLKGVKMVRDEMLAAFARFSLEPIDTKVGAELDPQCEEALGLLPVPGIAENHIAVVVRKGYRLHGKVLRAAQVMAGAGAPEADGPKVAQDEPSKEA